MKKLFVVFGAAVLALGLVACNKGQDTTDNQTNTADQQTQQQTNGATTPAKQ